MRGPQTVIEVSVVYFLRIGKHGSEVLLGRKLTGIGLGKLVGPGGKKEHGESSVETAVRESCEEVGLELDPTDLNPISNVSYFFAGRPELNQRSTAFAVSRWKGTPRRSQELAPSWWPLESLPFEQMWSDAQFWLTRALAGDYLEAKFTIDAKDEVVAKELNWAGGPPH